MLDIADVLSATKDKLNSAAAVVLERSWEADQPQLSASNFTHSRKTQGNKEASAFLGRTWLVCFLISQGDRGFPHVLLPGPYVATSEQPALALGTQDVPPAGRDRKQRTLSKFSPTLTKFGPMQVSSLADYRCRLMYPPFSHKSFTKFSKDDRSLPHVLLPTGSEHANSRSNTIPNKRIK